jgi:hypothetical protein
MILTKFNDIDKPIKEVWSKLNFKNLSLQSKMNILIENKKIIHEFDEEVENAFLYAVRFYDNLNTFVFFGLDKNDSYNYYLQNFKEDYIIYGIKYLEFEIQHIPKIMYQLLFPRTEFKYKSELYKELEENYPYLFNLYKSDSSKKRKLDISILIVCKRDINKKYPVTDISNSSCAIYLPSTKEEKWIASSIFLCTSSLRFIEKQNFDFFLTKDNEKSKNMFLGYRTWLNDTIDVKNQFQFILFSSVVLYLIGHRSMNDLDLYIHSIPKDIEEKVEQLKEQEFQYIEFQIKNTEKWPKYWNTWLDEWAQKCGAKYFEEILGNPKFHFYFLGIKIISLECDIVRRITRNRPRAIADLIAFRKRYAYSIDIPQIPLKYNKFISVSGKTEVEIQELIKENENSVFNESNEEIQIELDIDTGKFMNTIIYALETRYRMTFTVEDIRKELKMERIIDKSEEKKIIRKIKIKLK